MSCSRLLSRPAFAMWAAHSCLLNVSSAITIAVMPASQSARPQHGTHLSCCYASWRIGPRMLRIFLPLYDPAKVDVPPHTRLPMLVGLSMASIIGPRVAPSARNSVTPGIEDAVGDVALLRACEPSGERGDPVRAALSQHFFCVGYAFGEAFLVRGAIALTVTP